MTDWPKISKVKIVVYAPKESAEALRSVLTEAGAGEIGNYSRCSFSVEGVGRFQAETGANPTLGKKGVLEAVLEEKIEVICPVEKWEVVVAQLKKMHPYEEPAIDVIPLLN